MRYLLMLVAALIVGCSENAPEPQSDVYVRGGRSGEVSFAVAEQAPAKAPDASQQKIIRNGQLGIEVEDLDAAATTVRESVRNRGGRIESATRIKDERVHMRIRIPAVELDPMISDASALGRVLNRTVSENDVTTRYIDTEARLKTRLTLRDRLQALLETATSVEDILNIERELARVQGEIDSMQGQLNYMDRQVAESTLDLTLQISEVTPPEKKPGPLGYVFVGIWNGIKWLFVREG